MACALVLHVAGCFVPRPRAIHGVNHDAKYPAGGGDRYRERTEEQDAENKWIHGLSIGQLPTKY